jgi:hypothetical protein
MHGVTMKTMKIALIVSVSLPPQKLDGFTAIILTKTLV